LLLSDRQLGEDAIPKNIGMCRLQRVVDGVPVVVRHAAKAAAVDIAT